MRLQDDPEWQKAVGDSLSIWTVYDHPLDYPNVYVARRGEATAEGFKQTDDHIVSADLTAIRAILTNKGLEPMSRDPNDDPKIMEVWL